MIRTPPGADFCLPNLSEEDKERHEQFVDLFGQYIFWMRNWAVARSKQLAESDDARSSLGTVRRKRFDGVADLEPQGRAAAVTFAEATVDEFCDLLLRFLGNEGFDLQIGSGEAVQVLLEMQLVDQDSGNPVETEIINRNGKSMPDYWGRWLNRHRDK